MEPLIFWSQNVCMRESSVSLLYKLSTSGLIGSIPRNVGYASLLQVVHLLAAFGNVLQNRIGFAPTNRAAFSGFLANQVLNSYVAVFTSKNLWFPLPDPV